MRVHLRLRTHQDIGGNSASQGLPDPKAADAKEVSEKNTTEMFWKKAESFCLSSMPCAQDSMHLYGSESPLSPDDSQNLRFFRAALKGNIGGGVL